MKPDNECPSKKISFSSKMEAQKYMNDAKQRAKTAAKRNPRTRGRLSILKLDHAYKCSLCGNWHLSSEKDRKKITSNQVKFKDYREVLA